MIGKTILHYRILEQVGQGGMGVVYKAEDTKLRREVALKFLPTNALQGQAEKERFVREAQAAAALNHANIAHIYAIEEINGQVFITMEYVAGKELSEIVGANGGSPLSLDKTIDYATQIAAGLQAAHEKGVIHRDIKSANIMVTDKGVIKIMDFGLAKLANRSKMTIQGSTLGTAAYMSPEQARGEELDKRSDIWSLGVVLYEMIAGRLPFKGDYEQAVIYSILNEEPEPLTALRSGLPIALDGIVAKALAKDPNVRYQHVDELPADLKALDTAALTRSRISVVQQPSEKAQTSGERKIPWILVGILTVVLLLVLIFAFNSKSRGPVETLRLNLSLVTLPNQNLLRTGVQALALSPDGKRLVYTLSEEGQNLLYTRSLDSFTATPIKGPTNGRAPFFSPDGQWIGFLADGKLKKVSVSAGTVQTICDANGFRGASWGSNNTIILSPEFSSGLMVVSAEGGRLRQVSTLDSTQHERTHRWPQVLPGGEWVLYTIGSQDNPNSYVDARIAIQSIETGERHVLNVRGEMARYVAPGFLIIARNGSLLAATFSMKTFRTTQPLVPVLDNVDGDGGSGISYFAISDEGRLVYIPGIRNKDLELIWVDKQGKAEPLPIQSGSYSTPRISPDGSRLAVTVGQQVDGNYDIWMYNLKSGSFNRFTFGKSMRFPVWSPDGKVLYFAATSGEQRGIWSKPADGSSPETQIAPFELLPVAYVTRDGRKLILNRLGGSETGESIFALDLDQPQEPEALFPTGISSYSGNLSPDGRFITYGSNETGTLEIFVSTFPNQEGKWQLSSASGLNPLWSPDGKALYYISPLAKMMAVPISTNPVFSSGAPHELFDVSQMFFPNSLLANYDISPDGKRFVMIRNTRKSTDTQACNVILNWTHELQQKLGGDE
jgi:serine/threonine-protein kinase